MRCFVSLLFALAFTGCARRVAAPDHSRAVVPPEWTKGAVCYQVFVRSFHDSDGDGIGDLNGLRSKLDYINDGSPEAQRDLGARCLWLMPVTESPSYHGYDVVDYYRVDREYGTKEDFQRFVEDAHGRGVHVLVDMVLNHTSDRHAAFRAALSDTASPYRGWYRFSARHPGVKNPWGDDNWHRSPVSDEYYYAFFWHGMPDLNLENTEVREEAKRIATFWLREMSVDGFRLDAVKFFIEEGDRIQDTSGTHEFLREYAAHVRRITPDAFTVGEVWDSTGAVLPYYPDQLDAYFAFELADSILAAVQHGSARGLLNHALRLQSVLPDHRYATFLRNHDQTRTMTVLGGDVAGAKLAAALLLTLPGLPFVYYGEEIGMTGDKPDERIRTPMQWSAQPAGGFTRGVPWQPLQADWSRTNVAAQEYVDGSLLNLYRRLIHLRAGNAALARGELLVLGGTGDGVATYVRRNADGAVLVVLNLGMQPRALALTSAAAVLPPGRYAVGDLLGDVQPDVLTVGADGRIEDYRPVPEIAAREFLVLGLTALPSNSKSEPS